MHRVFAVASLSSLLLGLLPPTALCREIVEIPLRAEAGLSLHDGPGGDRSQPIHSGESDYYSDRWKTRVITNVVVPSLLVHRPAAGNANGSALIVAPGGAFHALSIDTEGHQVAEWLARRGVVAAVLKYRLVQTGTDAIEEMSRLSRPQLEARFDLARPRAIEDVVQALDLLQRRAPQFSIDPERIGLLGFSAGGAAVLGATQTLLQGGPSLLALVYPGAGAFLDRSLPAQLPELFLVVAADDPLGLADTSLEIAQAWMQRGQQPELHLYSSGGHGFGMRVQHLPSDSWIERFGEWLETRGWLGANPEATPPTQEPRLGRRSPALRRD